MKVLAATLLLLVQQGTPVYTTTDRLHYAAMLLASTIQERTKNDQSIETLSIGVGGLENRVLYIRDDTDDAKLFFMAMANSHSDRDQLLELGFKVVVLYNQRNGTYVWDLAKDDLVHVFDDGKARNV